MTIIDFRERARTHSEKAGQLLKGNCDSDVPYAALELRKSIEAIAYERVQNYQSDISPENLKQWQAPKVIAAVAAIDPGIEYIRKLSIEVETDDGSTQWEKIGTEHPFSMEILRKHYHALGSYLHMPTLHQVQNGGDHDSSKARKTCEAVLKALQRILANENWSISLTMPIEFPCGRIGCDSQIRRSVNSLVMTNLNASAESLEVSCFKCNATYHVTRTDEAFYQIGPQLTNMKCQHQNCDHKMQIWHADARNAFFRKKDFKLTCDGCNQESRVVLGLSRC